KIIFKRIYVWLPLALIVASLFYLWMMWRSRQDPAVSFLGPIESLSELWDYVSRRYYRMIEEKWQSRFIDRLLFFGDALVSVLWREWLFAGSALLLLGIYKIKRIFSAPQIWGLAFAFLSTTLFLQLTLKFEF